MPGPFNILVAGVGGQGNLVCGRIIAEAAVLEGLRPVIGDTFGASRRGGSVLTHIRIGESDWGPLVPKREAHVILGLEPMEALRASIDYAGENTTVMMSDIIVPIASVGLIRQTYPETDLICNALESIIPKSSIHLINVEKTAQDLGSTRVANAFMVGTLTAIDTPLTKTSLHRATKMILGHDEKNLTAFERGAAYAENLG
jgi:indolepyruvate ferredoxin oxidoreductase beta subunit